MVLRRLLAWLRYSSGPQSMTADGYITMIYLEKDRSVVVHDSLSESDEIFTSAIEVNEPNVEDGCMPEESFDYPMAQMEPTSLINPATGLLMLNEHIDVGGNCFGFGDD
ncbi:hypothetical protein CXK99_21165 [Stutzerimonas stutzeri]|uniref:Uncharacterized protein n=2 Tax=Stutzerimonas stutzeri group TaxID=136846 RepID=A0A2N8R8V8_STUST|nr:hypothetical protein CXK99_21165 [Stutzerimonas stutzeri]